MRQIYLLWVWPGHQDFLSYIYNTKQSLRNTVEDRELCSDREKETDRGATRRYRGWHGRGWLTRESGLAEQLVRGVCPGWR